MYEYNLWEYVYTDIVSFDKLSVFTFQTVNCLSHFIHKLWIGSLKCIELFDYSCFIIV